MLKNNSLRVEVKLFNTSGRAKETWAVPGATTGEVDNQRLKVLWSFLEHVALITSEHLVAALFWSHFIACCWEDWRSAV